MNFNFTKKTIAIAVASATIFTGLSALGVRQVIGSQAADQCRVSVDSYISLAEDQTKLLKTATSYMEMIEESPFSALALAGEIVRTGNDAEEGWENIEVAIESYYDNCVHLGFYGDVVDSYTLPVRREYWTAETELEEAREEVSSTHARVWPN